MLNYFTTWNFCLVGSRWLRHSQSRMLICTSACVSGTSLLMLLSNIMTNNWIWKSVETDWFKYLILDAAIHHAPFILMLSLHGKNPKGNALISLVPVTIYCCAYSNPYSVFGQKIKHAHGVALCSATALLVNVLTGYQERLLGRGGAGRLVTFS